MGSGVGSGTTGSPPSGTGTLASSSGSGAMSWAAAGGAAPSAIAPSTNPAFFPLAMLISSHTAQLRPPNRPGLQAGAAGLNGPRRVRLHQRPADGQVLDGQPGGVEQSGRIGRAASGRAAGEDLAQLRNV